MKTQTADINQGDHPGKPMKKARASQRRHARRAMVLLVLLACALPIPAVPALIPQPRLIAHWTGDNTAVDSSPTGNNGSFGGQYASTSPAGGKSFDLSTAKVTMANNSAYNFKSY